MCCKRPRTLASVCWCCATFRTCRGPCERRNTLVEDGGQRRPAHALASRCNAAWSLNYHKILVRYENAIVAAFTGHSHWDHFELHYRDDVARTEAAVINYIGPSATTSGSFPAFRIYEVGAAVRMARPRIGDAAAQPAARACIR